MSRKSWRIGSTGTTSVFRIIWPYLLGLGLFGVTIGMMVGLSKTSVVETVVTALFVLIGSGALFYVPLSLGSPDPGAEAKIKEAEEADAAYNAAKADTKSKETVLAGNQGDVQAKQDLETAQKVETDALMKAYLAIRERSSTDMSGQTYRSVGAGLAVFSLCIVLATLFFSLVRTGTNFSDLWPTDKTPPIGDTWSAGDTASALVLDRILLNLGVSAKGRAEASARLDTCSSAQAKSALSRLTNEARVTIPNADDTPAARALVSSLELLSEGLDPKPGQQAADAPIQPAPPGAIRQLLRDAVARLHALSGVDGWLRANPNAAIAFVAWGAGAAGFLQCNTADSVIAEVIADLVALKDTPLATAKLSDSDPHTTLESKSLAGK